MNEAKINCSLSINFSLTEDPIENKCNTVDINSDNMELLTTQLKSKGYIYMKTDATSALLALDDFKKRCQKTNMIISDLTEVDLRNENGDTIDTWSCVQIVSTK